MTAKTYLGKPCPKGHQDENGQNLRYLSNFGCVLCHNRTKFEKRRDGRDQKYVDKIIANRKEAKLKGEKHFLGGLCGRGHDYNGTGFSLKNTQTRSCVECKKLIDKSRRKLDKIVLTDEIDDRFFVGQLCRREHRYNGLEASLRRNCNKCCVECSRASNIKYEENSPPRKHSSYDIEIPQIPKSVDHQKMSEDYDNRIQAIKRFEYQLRKEMAT
ncbi:MAG: hypothetical protein LW728_21775 [Microcystis sp. 49638_E5]|jgi:hypothetical protein|uniref:hypothetical protein n=1 Tax=Microcystis sp. 49638_E5 TaxID=2904986 RepID=UPI002583A4AD|nr:hypothetical protein [Microcystis sp. 49638_E5]MCE2671770.1 hypothetical protein [Microcystis sp. 49638_E5]